MSGLTDTELVQALRETAGEVDSGQVRRVLELAARRLERGQWVSVKDRMPPNADHPGAFCPRYQVMTKYGVTEGWHNPDQGCWYTLVWFLIGRFDEDDIDMERGDIPRVSKTIEVTHWMPLPELPEVDE